jgi:hypothetical protein
MQVASFRVSARSGPDVHRVRIRHNPVAPPQVVCSTRPVGFFGIQEETFVEPADVFERFGTQQQHGSDGVSRA